MTTEELLGRFVGLSQIILMDGELTTHTEARLRQLVEEADAKHSLDGELGALAEIVNKVVA